MEEDYQILVQYPCYQCQEQFSNPTSLGEHVKLVHGGTFVCEDSEECTTSRIEYNLYMQDF